MKGKKAMTDHLATVAQSNMIDLSAGRFHYLSWGAEQTDYPCVLLLHGITSSALSWVRVGPALANRYRVYALDMRGHGDSVKPSPGAYRPYLGKTLDEAAWEQAKQYLPADSRAVQINGATHNVHAVNLMNL